MKNLVNLKAKSVYMKTYHVIPEIYVSQARQEIKYDYNVKCAYNTVALILTDSIINILHYQ